MPGADRPPDPAGSAGYRATPTVTDALPLKLPVVFAVIATEPAVTPLTTPLAASTVAIAALDVDQVTAWPAAAPVRSATMLTVPPTATVAGLGETVTFAGNSAGGVT